VGQRIMRDFKSDKKWSDRFIPEIKCTLGLYLISEAPFVEDAEHNTDLIVMTLKPYRIGCRMRGYRFFKEHPDDFTIRSDRPTGAKTEFTKIMEGWGDYLFYGFCDEKEESIRAWRLIDFKSFRAFIWKETQSKGFQFYAFDTSKMPDNIVKEADGFEAKQQVMEL